jgi:hypothetical protein
MMFFIPFIVFILNIHIPAQNEDLLQSTTDDERFGISVDTSVHFSEDAGRKTFIICSL